MLESLFEALFSYRPVVFQQGEFRFDVTTAFLVATLIVAVIVALAVLTYRRVRVNEGTSSRPDHPDLAAHRGPGAGASPVPSDPGSSAPLSISRTWSPCCWTTRAACRSRLGRQAARRLRQGAVRQLDSPLLKGLSDRFLVRGAFFRFVNRDPHGFGEGDELQRTADQARRRWTARATSSRVFRSPVSCSSPTARHKRRVRSTCPAGDEGAEDPGVYRRSWQ